MTERVIFTHKIGQFPHSTDLLGRLVACRVAAHVSWNLLTVRTGLHAYNLALIAPRRVSQCILCPAPTHPSQNIEKTDGRKM